MIKNLKKFIGILLSTSFIFSNNFISAFELKDNGQNSDNLGLSVDYFRELKKDNYIIGPGDTLSVKISYYYPELTRVVTVDGEGTIYLPKIKRIFVKGLTSFELVNLLTKAYEKHINFPEIEISLVNYRPIRILLEGEIINPGLLTIKGAMTLTKEDQNVGLLVDSKPSFYFPTVFDAIQGSGGITQNSDLTNIKVIRKNTLSEGGGQKMTTLNFERLLSDY